MTNFQCFQCNKFLKLDKRCDNCDFRYCDKHLFYNIVSGGFRCGDCKSLIQKLYLDVEYKSKRFFRECSFCKINTWTEESEKDVICYKCCYVKITKKK